MHSTKTTDSELSGFFSRDCFCAVTICHCMLKLALSYSQNYLMLVGSCGLFHRVHLSTENFLSARFAKPSRWSKLHGFNRAMPSIRSPNSVGQAAEVCDISIGLELGLLTPGTRQGRTKPCPTSPSQKEHPRLIFRLDPFCDIGIQKALIYYTCMCAYRIV